jgi:ATP phosphoribosyltransferase regulatory subunit
VFTRAGTKLASELIRFVDRDGRLVALRADFTSSIARVAATRLAAAERPLRLSYAGKVYRQRPEGGGHARETFQLGAELIGGARGRRRTWRCCGWWWRCCAPWGRRLPDQPGRHPLRPPPAGRAPPGGGGGAPHRHRPQGPRALAEGARRFGAPAAVARALVELPELIGRGEVLLRARSLASGALAESAIERLRAIDALLTPEEREHVVYDLGEIRGLGYYTGMQFEVFVAGSGRAVAFGGRYDALLELYGQGDPRGGLRAGDRRLADLVGGRVSARCASPSPRGG